MEVLRKGVTSFLYALLIVYLCISSEYLYIGTGTEQMKKISRIPPTLIGGGADNFDTVIKILNANCHTLTR